MADDKAKKDEIADALSRIEHDVPSEHAPSESIPSSPIAPRVPQVPPPPPASAAEFRRPSRPTAPGGSPSRPAAPAPTPTPAKSPSTAKPSPAKPKPARPDRPDRPAAPPTTVWSEAEAAEVRAHVDGESGDVIIDDDDAVIMPAPEPEVFAPHAPAKPAVSAAGMPRSLGFRRTVIPILLTCGVLLIGIGALKWVGGDDSLFSEMSTIMSATLGGSGVFLLLVAVLNMMQVRAELAQAKRAG